MRRIWLIVPAFIAIGCSDNALPTGPGSADARKVGVVTGGGPVPASGDRILVDTRGPWSSARSRAAAIQGLGADSWVGGNSWNFIMKSQTGLDAPALRLDWPASTGTSCTYRSAWISSPLPAPHPSRLYVQWKHHIGRTARSGYGTLGAFDLTSHACPTGRTLWSLFRQPDTLAAGRVDYQWTGASPVVPFVSVAGAVPQRIDAMATPAARIEDYAGRGVMQTLFVQRESAPGAGDGIVRLWIDDQLVLENTAAAVGSDVFRRMRFTGQAPLTKLQSEFFWDVLVWEPAGVITSPPSDTTTPPTDTTTPPTDTTPPAPVATTVTVSPASAAVTVGETTTLSATVKDQNGNTMPDAPVTWQSSDTTIATVSAAGVVSGRGAGQATITATSGSASGTSAISVSPVPVASVAVTPATASVEAGSTVQLTATTRDANGNVLTGRTVAWSSADTSVATVSADGLVTTRTVGSVTITATSEGASGTASITVTPVPVATVTVSPASASVAVNGTVQLTATLRDANGNVLTGRTVTWSSANTGVATVSATGLVTGKAAGSVTITATSEGKSGSADITVTGPVVTSVTITPSSATLQVGQTLQMQATARDASGNVVTGRPVTWATSAGGVASISSVGLVTAHSAGTATITGTVDGVSGTSLITVSAVSSVQGTYFVSPNGNDANPGSESQPFRTIQRAANIVVPGDIVIVEDGVYTDSDANGSIVDVNRGGTASAPVVFRSRNKWGAKLDGQNGFAHEGFDFNNNVGYVKIEGFEIYGVANVGSPRGSASGIDMYDGGSYVHIVRNHIHHIGRVCTTSDNTNGQVAIFVQKPGAVIEENLIHDIGRFFPGESGCSYTSTFGGYKTLDHGIYLNGGGGGASNTVIRNNVFYNTRHGWAIQWYPGSLANVQVLNNTFAFCNPNKNYTCIVLDASISSSAIINNVFYNPEGGKTMEAVGFSGSITIANNLTSGDAMADRISTGMSLSANLLLTDPGFSSVAAGDFHLRAGSPAIDAGQTLSSVTVDFDGRSRPRGSRHDIGAFEY